MSGIESIPAETRWTIATQALTGATIATSAAFRQAVGEADYMPVLKAIWAGAGKSSGEVADLVGLPRPTDAPGLWGVMETLIHLIMGPEFVGEVTESSPDKVVVRFTSCPWANRLNEQGVAASWCAEGHDSWATGVAEHLGLKITHTLPTVMPRGDAYCTAVIELSD